MYHAASKVEFQPLHRLYSQLTFFNVYKNTTTHTRTHAHMPHEQAITQATLNTCVRPLVTELNALRTAAAVAEPSDASDVRTRLQLTNTQPIVWCCSPPRCIHTWYSTAGRILWIQDIPGIRYLASILCLTCLAEIRRQIAKSPTLCPLVHESTSHESVTKPESVLPTTTNGLRGRLKLGPHHDGTAVVVAC
ncbi:unnamed protein product [Laminaria digitata]